MTPIIEMTISFHFAMYNLFQSFVNLSLNKKSALIKTNTIERKLPICNITQNLLYTEEE